MFLHVEADNLWPGLNREALLRNFCLNTNQSVGLKKIKINILDVQRGGRYYEAEFPQHLHVEFYPSVHENVPVLYIKKCNYLKPARLFSG